MESKNQVENNTPEGELAEPEQISSVRRSKRSSKIEKEIKLTVDRWHLFALKITAGITFAGVCVIGANNPEEILKNMPSYMKYIICIAGFLNITILGVDKIWSKD